MSKLAPTVAALSVLPAVSAALAGCSQASAGLTFAALYLTTQHVVMGSDIAERLLPAKRR